MTPLRRKRLLLLAWCVGDCKSWYSWYCRLMRENPSPVFWALGQAFLTDTGQEELKHMLGGELPRRKFE